MHVVCVCCVCMHVYILNVYCFTFMCINIYKESILHKIHLSINIKYPSSYLTNILWAGHIERKMEPNFHFSARQNRKNFRYKKQRIYLSLTKWIHFEDYILARGGGITCIHTTTASSHLYWKNCHICYGIYCK